MNILSLGYESMLGAKKRGYIKWIQLAYQITLKNNTCTTVRLNFLSNDIEKEYNPCFVISYYFDRDKNQCKKIQL